MRVLIFGCNDITKIVIEEFQKNDAEVLGVVTHKNNVKISYCEKLKIHNHCDLKTNFKESIKSFFTHKNNQNVISFIKNNYIDYIFVCGWYFKISQEIINAVDSRIFGVHFSLLPKLRGGAPLNWAILRGEKKTGITIFQISNKIDSGNYIIQKSFSISNSDYINDLIEKSKNLLKKSIKEFVLLFKKKKIILKKQNGKPSYVSQRFIEDSRINWKDDAVNIDKLIRASSKPYFGAFSYINDKKIRVEKALIENNSSIKKSPGTITIYDQEIFVSTRTSLIKIVKCYTKTERNTLKKSNNLKLT